MSSLSRLSVWLEYFFFAGIIIGQVLAFAVGFAVSLIRSSDEFQMVPALIAWAVWLLFVGLFVRRGIRDSERRRPSPVPAG
jgi:hypothetical protein